MCVYYITAVYTGQARKVKTTLRGTGKCGTYLTGGAMGKGIGVHQTLSCYSSCYSCDSKLPGPRLMNSEPQIEAVD